MVRMQESEERVGRKSCEREWGYGVGREGGDME